MRKQITSLIFSAFLLCGCADPTTPEAQIRAAVDAMERAAEARDASDLMEHIAAGYRDAQGHDAQALRRYVQGYFLAHPSIHLLTRIEAMEFPSSDEARTTVAVGMLGRGADGDAAWDLAADVHTFEVSWVREGGEWRVAYAEWGRPR